MSGLSTITRLPCESPTDADGIPKHLVHSLRGYAAHHYSVGGFLRAVLANDLMQVVGRADNDSLAAIARICAFVHNAMPARCHGSYEIVDRWLANA